ncbi:alginate O-acetyltransferase AlgX-related protein [Pontibacter sp. G13]|uniref:alginate O-acetyltransferase AlgX-related protein n=1 Tax=Pontibacter sp. G13 TaxID=3074898 RepID=UPI00288A6D1D|nr:hypothetical protein [Pontibacter sp. G13]WNJ20302.1 hypothetical protein RJD25_07465 [Pontibacter sp. G13]
MNKRFITWWLWLLAILMVGVLTLPALQQWTNWVRVPALQGAFTNPPEAQLSVESWFSGKFQSEAEAQLNAEVGFRPSLVRLRNELEYQLYGRTHAQYVFAGKDGVLFEHRYIESLKGDNFMGVDAIVERNRKLKAIQDTLNGLGKDLLVMIAPGKGRLYPEYVPDHMLPTEQKPTNYPVTIADMQRQGIHLMDCMAWFYEIRDSVPYPLMPKTGIHWSEYAEYLVTDSLVRYFERQLSLDLPDLVLMEIQESTEARGRDADIEVSLNLMSDIPDGLLGYPQYYFQIDSTHDRLSMLTIGDSFYWGPWGKTFAQEAFKGGQFFYYHSEAYPDSHDGIVVNPNDLPWSETLAKHDVIMFLYTETATDLYFGNYSIDQIYSYFFGDDAP